MEEWRTIPDVNGYEVSNDGKVRSLDKTSIVSIMGASIQRTRKGQALKLQKKSGKYPYIKVTCNYKQYYVHRLVALAFIPNPIEKPHVNHIDGDKTNNRVSNLEWVTIQENHHHARAAGMYPPGWNAKLTNEQVMEIRRLYRTGKYKQVALAKLFDVDPRTISGIVNLQYRTQI